MSQYRAQDGLANDCHPVHLGRFALDSAGLVFCEATAVQAHGRRTHGDLGSGRTPTSTLRRLPLALDELVFNALADTAAHAHRRRLALIGEAPSSDDDDDDVRPTRLLDSLVGNAIAEPRSTAVDLKCA